jgi:hypothetical protein
MEAALSCVTAQQAAKASHGRDFFRYDDSIRLDFIVVEVTGLGDKESVLRENAAEESGS